MSVNFRNINSTKTYLLVTNILLVFFLIFLSNLGILPFRSIGDFGFFAFLVLALALYRPWWALLFFVGTITLENITLAPENLNLSLRPYQLFAGAILAALIIRWMVQRASFLQTRFQWPDYFLGFVVLFGFASVIGADEPRVNLKSAIIFASFFILYLLSRMYLREEKDVRKIIPVFLSSALIVTTYGIWQNFRFMRGLSHFEVMPGRPNATFTEPDWLGIYLVLLIALAYSLIWYVNKTIKNNAPSISNFQSRVLGTISGKISNFKFQILNLFLFIFLTLIYVLLILTVSRSAWIGTFFVTLVFLFIALAELKLNFREWKWVEFLKHGLRIGTSAGISVIVVYAFSLTPFQLFNRAQSAASGLQKITLACPGNLDVAYPKEINNLSEAAKYSCRHINLEDIKKEKADGSIIIEALRPDPNVNIRKEIYQKSWNEIKTHPVLGIGWGSVGKILGSDTRGSLLNSSNIFLEVWLGSGFLGLLAFAGFWIWIILKSILSFSREEGFKKYVSLFTILGSIGLIVANLFNAGVFLGILYLFFAIAMI